MTPSDSPQTANLSGLVLSPDRQPIFGLWVMAVNARDLLQQHTLKTDGEGHFAMDLPRGCYDLFFFDEIHEPLMLAGVAIEEDLTKEIVRPLAQPSTSAIYGAVNLPNGEPTSGYTIGLYDGSASNRLASAGVGSQGDFKMDGCDYGYYLLLIQSPEGESQWIPLPKPATSLEVNLTLLDARPLDPLALTDASPNAGAGGTFSVCQDGQAHWVLTGGFMAPGSGPISTNVLPFSVNIHVESSLVGYAVYVDRRAQVSPFGPVPAFGGYYWFTDQSGDTYFLIAILPYLHSVAYSSVKPNITQVEFTQGIPYSGAWPDAPRCG